jgi:chromosome segregation ATPase
MSNLLGEVSAPTPLEIDERRAIKADKARIEALEREMKELRSNWELAKPQLDRLADVERELAEARTECQSLQRNYGKACDVLSDQRDALKARVAELEQFITHWRYDGSLQTFNDREKFRASAYSILVRSTAETTGKPE